MDTITKPLADPATLARISSLELRARVVVEGFITGMHRSPHRGSSVEFAQHREYVPGDEIRHIDWKVYARTDRFHIKQYEEETNLKATLVVDTSSSMNYKGAKSPLSKREYGAVVAAALAHLLMGQRDAVGLALFDDGIRKFIPAASTPTHRKLLTETLSQTDSRPKTGLGETFHDLAERVRRRGLLIVVSDFFTDPKDVMKGLQHFRHRKHEVILFHILDRDELSFPFKDTTIFQGLEGEAPINAEPNALRRGYLKAFEEFTDTLKRGCRELGMDYQLFATDDPVDVALSKYLARRMQRN